MQFPAVKDERLLEDRRKLVLPNTPERLSQILSNWVIRSASDTVLEPSFGNVVSCKQRAAACWRWERVSAIPDIWLRHRPVCIRLFGHHTWRACRPKAVLFNPTSWL